MTRFAGHSDITNFLQRNQFADKVGACLLYTSDAADE